MEKSLIGHIAFFVSLLFISGHGHAQSLSESELKSFAETVNERFKGSEIGYGVVLRGCLSSGKTMIYQYDVPSNWEPTLNLKEEIIANLKTAGAANTYFIYDINVDFFYFKGNSLIHKVSVNSYEFSNFDFELGDYLSIKDHPKSKEVNLKLRVPKGWQVQEGDRPNIVKKFVRDGNVYALLIKENMTFFSRNESMELLSDDQFLKELTEEASSYMNESEVIDKSVVTVDSYPAATFKATGQGKYSGITVPMVMRSWFIYYEDKIIFLQAAGTNDAEFKALEQLYFRITNSLIFPDQYN